ncbi:hypothetical protein AB6A40_008635 [Gnathostoma spinigerum]|uniref:Uncharacterized protein n=1 Tax=Gnathostoma spinigerum TaxID=75299 RepID=A0ABD6EWQ6_9BILA
MVESECECRTVESLSLDDYGFFSDLVSDIDTLSNYTESTIECRSVEPESPSPVMRAERSVSLNSALKKKHSNGNKKVVHFADSLGLDLVDVRPYYSVCDEDDEIFGTTPPLFLKGFHQSLYVTPFAAPRKTAVSSRPSSFFPSTYLHCQFTPLARYQWCETKDRNTAIVARANTEGVCLQSVSTCGMNITGMIAVGNFGYKKEVSARSAYENTLHMRKLHYSLSGNYIVDELWSWV